MVVVVVVVVEWQMAGIVGDYGIIIFCKDFVLFYSGRCQANSSPNQPP